MKMYLAALHPGTTVEEVCENVGWDLMVADQLTITGPPTAEELRIIREELDPQGIYRS